MTDEFKAPRLDGYPLAMVYSPFQEWEDLYDVEEGHSRGTIFKKLDFPFYPTACNRGCGCREK